MDGESAPSLARGSCVHHILFSPALYMPPKGGITEPLPPFFSGVGLRHGLIELRLLMMVSRQQRKKKRRSAKSSESSPSLTGSIMMITCDVDLFAHDGDGNPERTEESARYLQNNRKEEAGH